MSKDRPRNVAASVRQRLTNLSREAGDEFRITLIRFAIERLLYRLSVSGHAERFVLKGATLFAVLTGERHRPTEDLDLLGTGDPDPARMVAVFREVCAIGVEDDGLVFDPASVSAAGIKEAADYPGVRVRCVARLEQARIDLQIDIGFGDAVRPSAPRVEFPAILGQPTPTIRVYPCETVVAEKFQAMVALGLLNSRMKDFFDIHLLARRFPFDGVELSEAIDATFDRRRTAVPTEPPTALTPAFRTDRSKVTQWTAFLRKSRLTAEPLEVVCLSLESFLMPVSSAVAAGTPFTARWPAGGPWMPADS